VGLISIKALQVAVSNGLEAQHNSWDGSYFSWDGSYFATTRIASKRAYAEAGNLDQHVTEHGQDSFLPCTASRVAA